MNDLYVNAIRILAADMIQKANSGHPGLPLGAAPMAYELFANHLRYNSSEPCFTGRDRFVLSAGHGSAMLYSLLHLFGYGLSIEDLKNFRQLDSLTPGHPEWGHTAGVEATTGPLGAGLGMAVGMAMAQSHMAAVFNEEGFPIFDNYIYCLVGDGCLMEGISSEVSSLAGTLGLGRLIVLYDSNHISIEGDTNLAFAEDVLGRFKAFGFQTLEVEDGTDTAAIGEAIKSAKNCLDKPSFIKVHTKIGYGVPKKEGTASAHGEPLGEENISALRTNLNWPSTQAFDIPDEVYQHYHKLAEKGKIYQADYEDMLSKYEKSYPDKMKKLMAYYEGGNLKKLEEDKDFWALKSKANATRSLSGEALNHIAKYFPELIGGSADLAPSNKSDMSGEAYYSKTSPTGRNIHFGVRELGMTAIANGIILFGGLRAYVATFFVFSDYMKPMLRLASLMGLPLISVLTHDSIGVGEDGPTHEPVEQLAMLRAQPNLNVIRPADEMETKQAWFMALSSKKTPSCLVLSRQNLPPINTSSKEARRGGYIVKKEIGQAIDLLIVATGSELHLAIKCSEELEKLGKSVRVISMPCLDIYLEQSAEYREEIIPGKVKNRAVIEAGSSASWGKIIGIDGCYITLDEFGASAPADLLFKKFGFGIDEILAKFEVYLG